MSEDKKIVESEGTEASAENKTAEEQANAQAEKKKATDGNNGVYVHEFKKPFEYDGKKFEKINFYFNKLKGKDMIAIEAEMQEMGEYALAPEISRGFQCRMAAKAANIGADTLEGMPLPEFNKITNAARDFLISSGY